MAFSEPINAATFTIADITQNGTATGINWDIINSGDNQNFILRAIAVTGEGTIIPSISVGAVQDSAGHNNNLSGSTDNTVTIDTIPPHVSAVAFLSPDNNYTTGTAIDLTVTFTENVTVASGGGTPRLQLSVGGPNRYATYLSGSGTSILTFRYTVMAWDNSADLDYSSTSALGTNGGTIRDAVAHDAILTLPAVGTLAVLHAISVRPCPSGYIHVSPNPDVGTTSEFCVMKYEAKDV